MPRSTKVGAGYRGMRTVGGERRPGSKGVSTHGASTFPKHTPQKPTGSVTYCQTRPHTK
jgi:hypothetical protein